MLSTLLAVEICARIMKIHWWSIFERQSHIFFVVRRVVINVRLLSFCYLMIINAQCTYFVPFEMNCFCECVCSRSQSVADFTMQYPKFYCTQYHNQLQSMRECIRFFRSIACFNFKVSTGFSHFSTAFGRFPGTKKYKREKFQSLKNKHRRELPKKTTRFPDFLRFSAIYSRALNFICSEYGGMDAWMQKKIDSNWSNSSSSGEFFYALV